MNLISKVSVQLEGLTDISVETNTDPNQVVVTIPVSLGVVVTLPPPDVVAITVLDNAAVVGHVHTNMAALDNVSGVNTGDQDLSALALKSNVLELDNTSFFNPDADYEPATKKYVDDNSGAGPSDTLNVKSYGAVGDGITDDWPACQSAIDAAVAGDTVYFPAGSYFLSTGWIAPKSDVRILGAGMGATTLLRGESSPTAISQGANAQPVMRLSTYQKDGTGYVGPQLNVEVCDLKMDLNLANLVEQDLAGMRHVYIVGGNDPTNDRMDNINFHHVRFSCNLPGARSTTSVDAWSFLLYEGAAGNNRNLRITDCIHDAEFVQFISGGGQGWNGVQYERNWCYHTRETSIAITGQAGNGGQWRNISICDNHITGIATIGIKLGSDGLQQVEGMSMDGVVISGNTILGDDWIEDVVTDLGQHGIEINSTPLHINELVISNNTIRRMDAYNLLVGENTTTEFEAIRLLHWTNNPGTPTLNRTASLDSSFTQPAVGSTVSGVGISSSYALPPGTILQMGDATNPGGRYQITVDEGAGKFTLKRMPWPVGTADGVTVPNTVVCLHIGELRDVVVEGNTCDGMIKVEYADGCVIANNIIYNATSTRALQINGSINLNINNNLIRDGRVEFDYINQGFFTHNIIGAAPEAAGNIQQKSNPDELGRLGLNDWYMADNISSEPIDTPTYLLLAQTSTPVGGSHRLRGNIIAAAAPEGKIIADPGTLCTDIANGNLYLKGSGTSNTGWKAVAVI